MQGQSKRHAAWQAPFLAFYSKDFYADVAYNWTGTGMRYLSLVVSVAWFITVTLMVTIPCIAILNDHNLSEFCKQMPKLKVSNGRLSIDKPCPYEIRDGKGATVVLFMDGRQELPAAHSNVPFVIGRDSLTVNIAGVEAKNWQFAAVSKVKSNLELDVDAIFSSIKAVLPWLPLIYFAGGLPLVSVFHLLQMFFYAGAAILIARACRQRISYKIGLRLSAIAMTPGIVISTLIVVMTVALFPVRFLHLLILYAPMHSWALHHPFAIISVVLVISYLFLAALSLKPMDAVPAPGAASGERA